VFYTVIEGIWESRGSTVRPRAARAVSKMNLRIGGPDEARATDTEIDKVYFEKLAPHIARVYHLEYDNQIKSSLASEGYFWKPIEVIHD
jgi:hypothetical protein